LLVVSDGALVMEWAVEHQADRLAR
jgi:hypothetical protein